MEQISARGQDVFLGVTSRVTRVATVVWRIASRRCGSGFQVVGLTVELNGTGNVVLKIKIKFEDT